MKNKFKKSLLILGIILIFSLQLLACSNKSKETSSNSTNENNSSITTNTDDNSSISTNNNATKNNQQNTANLTENTDNNQNKIKSKNEALNILKNYINTSQGGLKDNMTIEEAPSDKFAKELNIDKIKKDYYVFFLEWKEGGAKVYLVNKTSGDIFDYSVTGEITPVK